MLVMPYSTARLGFERCPPAYPGEVALHAIDLSHSTPIHWGIEHGSGLDATFLQTSMSLVDGFFRLPKVGGDLSKACFRPVRDKQVLSTVAPLLLILDHWSLEFGFVQNIGIASPTAVACLLNLPKEIITNRVVKVHRLLRALLGSLILTKQAYKLLAS